MYEDLIEAYAAKVQQLLNDYHAKYYPNINPAKVSVQYLRRYARIVSDHGAHSFVDLETGDILKSASWKAPAKGKRGHVSDLTKGFDHYGAEYRR